MLQMPSKVNSTCLVRIDLQKSLGEAQEDCHPLHCSALRCVGVHHLRGEG